MLLLSDKSVMPVFQLPATVLPALSFAIKMIAEEIPSRWEKVAIFMQAYLSKNPALMSSSSIKNQGNILLTFNSIKNRSIPHT